MEAHGLVYVHMYLHIGHINSFKGINTHWRTFHLWNAVGTVHTVPSTGGIWFGTSVPHVALLTTATNSLK
jgi:hypothetical protein